MSVSFTQVIGGGNAGGNTKAWDVIATADGDTIATIPHGFGEIPIDVTITPLHNVAAVSLWRVTSVDATNIVLTKSTTASSSNAAAQVRVIARRNNFYIH